jgi:hypothetical protein
MKSKLWGESKELPRDFESSAATESKERRALLQWVWLIRVAVCEPAGVCGEWQYVVNVCACMAWMCCALLLIRQSSCGGF